VGVTRPQHRPGSQGQGPTGSRESERPGCGGGKKKASPAQAGEKLKDTANKERPG